MEQVVAYILLPTCQLPGLFLTTYGVPSCLGGFGDWDSGGGNTGQLTKP